MLFEELEACLIGSHLTCFKAFDCLHKPINDTLQSNVINENVPKWIVTGKTALIQKDPVKDSEVSNNRRITCLQLV